jgi:hypothetical protein
MAKKKIYYWVLENSGKNERRIEITSRAQFFNMDLSSKTSKIIISNYEMDNIKRTNEVKIKEIKIILKNPGL